MEHTEYATTDNSILDALQGLKEAQREIREIVRTDDQTGASMALAFFKGYYDKLPSEITSRLDQIMPEAVEQITHATRMHLTGISLKRFAEQLASDAAYQQVIRAANVYRKKLGYTPLGPDGYPIQMEEPDADGHD